jgi:hypothetical protein
MTAAQWLESQFEFEYCAECSGDARHHTALEVFGQGFARCDFPPDDETGAPHPVIAAFRASVDAA